MIYKAQLLFTFSQENNSSVKKIHYPDIWGCLWIFLFNPFLFTDTGYLISNCHKQLGSAEDTGKSFQKLATSAEHVVYPNCSECWKKTKTTICVHNMFCRYSELTIFMNNEQSVIILWVTVVCILVRIQPF